MNYWTFGKTWQTAGLQAQSVELDGHSSQLTSHSQDVLALRMPNWLGTAADIAKVDRELIASRLEHLATLLDQVSQLEDSGAAQLKAIQADMEATEDVLQQAGFRVGENGRVWRENVIGRIDLPTWLSQAAAAVRALAQRVEDLDKRFKQGVDNVAEAAKQTRKREEALDFMNSMRLQAIPGALDGVDWNFKWKYNDLLPIPFEMDGPGAWLYKKMYSSDVQWGLKNEGELPRWLQDYLMDGTMPAPAEVISLHAYNRINRHDLLGDIVWDQLNDKLGGGQWNIDAKDMRTFFEDGHPRRPEIMGNADGSLPQKPVPKNLADLIGHMEAIYEPTRANEHGAIEVRVHEVNGVPYFTAVLPGASGDIKVLEGWDGRAYGTDWPANVHAKGYGTSAVTQTSIAAIDDAVRDYEQRTGRTIERPNIMLAGHSQGGINAANIGADRSFAARYNVEYVVGAGSPISDVEMRGNTKVVNFVNQYDGTAGLSGTAEPVLAMARESVPVVGRFIPESVGHHVPQDSYHQVTFMEKDYPNTQVPNPGLKGWVDSHEPFRYQDRLAESLAGGTPDSQVVTMHNSNMSNYFHGDGQDVVYRITTGRQL